MANNEATFKVEWKRDIQACYGNRVKAWSHWDSANVGLPDQAYHFSGKFYPCEAKFVNSVPARDTSKLLKHELTETQASFLDSIVYTGGYPMIVIGMPDIAAVIPFIRWPTEDDKYADNVTLGWLKDYRQRNSGLFIPKEKGTWKVVHLFKMIQEYYELHREGESRGALLW